MAAQIIAPLRKLPTQARQIRQRKKTGRDHRPAQTLQIVLDSQQQPRVAVLTLIRSGCDYGYYFINAIPKNVLPPLYVNGHVIGEANESPEPDAAAARGSRSGGLFACRRIR